MNKIIPHTLIDLVGVISPSNNLKESDWKYIDNSIKKCNELGLDVVISPNAFSDTEDLNLKIEEKISDFNAMITSSVQGIFFSKGGNFCKKLLDKIDYSLISNNPKIIGGISDGTFLLNAIYAKSGLITFHMSDFKRLFNNNFNELAFKEMFINKKIGPVPQNKNWVMLRGGAQEGILIGGNLSCISELSNTDYFPRDESLILFLEEVQSASSLEGIKKNIDVLKKNGILKRIKGLLIGDYNNDFEVNFEDILLPILDDFDFPIVKCHDFGHGGVNLVLPIGANVKLDGDNSQLILLEDVIK